MSRLLYAAPRSPEDPHARDAAVTTGPVVIDVGAGRGALVLDASPEDCGREVEIHPIGAPFERTHVAVLARSGTREKRYAAVFPSLPAGRYVVLTRDASPTDAVTIRSGEVTTSKWLQARAGSEGLIENQT